MGFWGLLETLGGALGGGALGAGLGAGAGAILPGVSVKQGMLGGAAAGALTGGAIGAGVLGKLMPGGGGNGTSIGGPSGLGAVGGLRPTRQSIRAHFGRRISNEEFAQIFDYYPKARRRKSSTRSSKSMNDAAMDKLALKIIDAIN